MRKTAGSGSDSDVGAMHLPVPGTPAAANRDPAAIVPLPTVAGMTAAGVGRRRPKFVAAVAVVAVVVAAFPRRR